MTSPGPDTRTILVVDDDERLREQLARALSRRGYDVLSAADFPSALALAKEHVPELAVIDLRMPGRDGLELLRALKEIDPETRVVMLTGYGSIATALEAVRLGATHYLQKPADTDEILAAFARDETSAVIEAQRDATTPSLERVKWEHVSRVLADSDGNVSEAARKLKLHRRSLQRMLHKRPPRE